MTQLPEIVFSQDFISRWKTLLKKLYGYSFYEDFAVVPSLWRTKTYSYLPLLNYTDRTSDQAETLLEKVEGRRYQLRLLNFSCSDFQENDPVTMRIDLQKKNTEELYSAVMSRRNRRYIRQLEKEKIVIKKGHSPDQVELFYDIFAEVMHRHGTPVFGRNLFSALARIFQTTFYVTFIKDQPVSAAVVLDDEDMSWIPWSGTSGRFLDSRPGLMMYWQTIKDAYVKKKKVYDFGRSSYGSGPYVYKKRWGAVPVKIDILQPGKGNVYQKYGFASFLWKKLPHGTTLRLGPWICKYLSDL